MAARPLRVSFLLSGSGTTLENLLARLRDGRLRGIEIVQVISSRQQVRGVEIARSAGLPVEVIRRGAHPDEPAFSRALDARVDAARADVVAMGGFLVRWLLAPRFAGRVLNIHPALLPRFGGAGMYGLRVHAAVLAAGERESGCTVHLVDHEYDHGPIVAQARVPVCSGDTPETLAQRVQAAERELYPWVLAQVAAHGLEWLAQSGRSQLGR